MTVTPPKNHPYRPKQEPAYRTQGIWWRRVAALVLDFRVPDAPSGLLVLLAAAVGVMVESVAGVWLGLIAFAMALYVPTRWSSRRLTGPTLYDDLFRDDLPPVARLQRRVLLLAIPAKLVLLALLLSMTFLFGCLPPRPAPALKPVYDCTNLPVKRQQVFDQQITTCNQPNWWTDGDDTPERCLNRVMRAYCKPLPQQGKYQDD